MKSFIKQCVAEVLLYDEPITQSVERATSGEGVPGSIPDVAARTLQVGAVAV